MKNIAQAAVTAHTHAEAVVLPFKQKSLEMGSAKKDLKEVSVISLKFGVGWKVKDGS